MSKNKEIITGYYEQVFNGRDLETPLTTTGPIMRCGTR
jgi:hypothetical protein